MICACLCAFMYGALSVYVYGSVASNWEIVIMDDAISEEPRASGGGHGVHLYIAFGPQEYEPSKQCVAGDSLRHFMYIISHFHLEVPSPEALCHLQSAEEAQGRR